MGNSPKAGKEMKKRMRREERGREVAGKNVANMKYDQEMAVGARVRPSRSRIAWGQHLQ